jgi:alpha-tubulin suppressor-like RCC1 family protein
MHEKQAMIDDISMDIIELLVRNHDERPPITETGSSDISHSKSKIAEDDDCTVIATENGLDFA